MAEDNNYEIIGKFPTVIKAKGKHNEFKVFLFEFPNGSAPVFLANDDTETVPRLYSVLQMGEILPGDSPLVRVHSACHLGDTLRHVVCDCGDQYEEAIDRIAEEGTGVVVYCQGHEGRGIGPKRHFQAYELQYESGANTFESYEQLGFPVDSRDYSDAITILRDHYGLRALRLLTNNPDKIKPLTEGGIEVVRVPLWVPRTKINEAQFEAKLKRGHLPPEIS